MRKTAYLTFAAILVLVSSLLIYHFTKTEVHNDKQSISLIVDREEEKEEGGYKKRLYEWKMLHDPATGEIPKDIRIKEAEFLAAIKSQQSGIGFRQTINNSYTAAGPSQNGGRTRAIAYDIRNNNVVLAAGVSGGIFRSTDGGATWNYVHPAVSLANINNVRNVSCLAQDPRPGFQDTWYAGTGELLGSSPSYPNSFVFGDGIYKSTNNGLSWSKLPVTSGGYPFNFIFNMKVAPNGFLYVAALNYILLTNDGGTTWFYALRTVSNQNTEGMITDIAISNDGSRYYASFSGINSRRDTVGVWTSTTGTSGWSRIAGGVNGQPDSVAGWKAYNSNLNNGTGWGRTILTVAPSNPNILYVMYQNSLSAGSAQSEADLFRADLTSFPTVNWTANRGPNLTATRIRPPIVGGGSVTTYMETQEGYNMLLAVHPTNPNLVVAGGVNLYKSTDAFATQGSFIGGLTSTTYTDPDLTSHVDFHSFAFHPGTPNRFVTGHDGGLSVTNDITAGTISWSNLNGQYQTLQYYHVAIDPTPGSLTFAGGAQDNSTTYRDSKSLLSGSPLPAPTEANDHYVVIGGDGGSVGLSASTTTQYLYASVQEGALYRLFANGLGSTQSSSIAPSGSPGSEFITYFHHDPDNTNTIYYAGLNTLWRTTSATTASAAGGWTQMTGVSNLVGVGNSIFALATSRGTYASNSSYLFIGTDNGKIYRLQNPKDGAASTTPVDISPLSFLGMTNESLVRDIAVNPRNPDTVLAVVSNYGVVSAFWTGNALSASPTWEVAEGNISLPSFRSCAIVATATGVEYYVGTSIGLFSTTTINGSASPVWALEGSAVLQGAIVNDLALRPADNTLLVGTHGNGMFYSVIGNVATSVPDVITNDKRFITSVFPTIASNNIYFRKGNLTGIQTINIRITSTNGQVVAQQRQSYQNGSLSTRQLASGNYVLEIWSDDRKYKHVQQFVKSK
ncbi:T9SS type A sorting domain-containing protein [Lacibacter sp. H407]|uniref:T9SS type A sorting domain-containing protein n=1 Tax=Lacibacter sp. H407 TaxID=3133423 RepID=UPI0030C4F479